METLTGIAVLLGLGGSLWWDVRLTLGLSRRFYQLICRVPVRPLRLEALPSPGRPIRRDSLVIGVSSEGLQARSTKKKHHILLRVDADGRARAGTSAWMWACFLVWSAVLVLMAGAALLQPLPQAALLLAGITATGGGTWLLLRARTRAMIDAVERAVAAQLVEERLREIQPQPTSAARRLRC